MTVKSPSPVIMSGLWQAVPAEVPPITAPRWWASSDGIADRGAEQRLGDAPLVAAGEEDPSRRSDPVGDDRVPGVVAGPDLGDKDVAAAVVVDEEIAVVLTGVGLAGGGGENHDRRVGTTRELDELLHHLARFGPAAVENQVARRPVRRR